MTFLGSLPCCASCMSKGRDADVILDRDKYRFPLIYCFVCRVYFALIGTFAPQQACRNVCVCQAGGTRDKEPSSKVQSLFNGFDRNLCVD